MERIALIGFLSRLLGRFGVNSGGWAEGQMSKASAEELDRLVEIAMTVLSEEAKGR
jgi:hypothetical protein